MKIIKNFIVFALLSVTILACKKGENDPFLSLSSRKARLAGEWKLTKMDELNVSNNGTNTTCDIIGHQ